MNPQQLTEDRFYVGDVFVEPSLNRIVKSGHRLTLEPRVMKVLVHLASRKGQVVTREELMAAVWEDVIVSEKAITQTISALRKALEDDWKHPGYLETISKNGYRLIADVRDVTDDPSGDGRFVPQSWSLGDSDQDGAGSHDSPRSNRTLFTTTNLIVALAVVALGALAFTLIRTTRHRADPAIRLLYGLPASSLPGNVVDGVISPDGKQIAFSWTPPETDNYDVYVKLIDAENAVRLTHSPRKEDYPSWSPDGNYLTFVSRMNGGCEIHRIPVIGGPSVRLGDCTLSPLSNPSWSPDGEWLARSDAPAMRQVRRIVLLNVQSGEERVLTEPPSNGRGDRNPVFSPDGRYVAFVRVSSNGLSDLYRVSLDNGRIEQITFDRWEIFGLDWMPDGREILFGSSRSGRMGFWRVSADGGVSSVFPIADQQIVNPSLSREIRNLVYSKFTDDTNVWAADLDDGGSIIGKPSLVISSSREDMFPQVSPFGRRLAFISRRTGFAELWTSDLEGSNLIQHTRFEGPPVSAPSWAPDGRTLLFDVRIDGQAALYTVAADERFPARMTRDRWDEMNGSWSGDGESIYYSSNRSGSWQIWKRPADGGSAVQLTTDGGFRALEGPTGSMLFYTKHDTTGLWQRPMRGDRESMIIDDLWIADWSNWTVVDDGVFFVQSEPRTIAFYDFGGRKTRSLFNTSSRLPLAGGSSIAVAQDGRRLFYTRIDGGNLNLMLIKGY